MYGYVYVVDRKKDMIISGGYNIFPADIEAVVGGYPAVEDVCVVGAPHALWGESPVAAVLLRPGMAATPEEIRAWANERLAKTQRIAAVVATPWARSRRANCARPTRPCCRTDPASPCHAAALIPDAPFYKPTLNPK